MSQVIYIDADIFYEACIPNPTKDNRILGKDNLWKIISAKKRNNAIDVIVPMVTLGECFHNIRTDELDAPLCLELMNKLEVQPEVADITAYQFTNELLSVPGTHITSCDALFISQSLCNPDTTIILATDGEFTSNPVINDKILDHPKNPSVRSMFQRS